MICLILYKHQLKVPQTFGGNMKLLTILIAINFALFFNIAKCNAENLSTICFANKAEYLCLEANSPDELIKKLDAIYLPSGKYEVFIDKKSGWKIKLHFSGNKRIKKAKLVESGTQLPKGAFGKLQEKSTKSYYRAKIEIE